MKSKWENKMIETIEKNYNETEEFFSFLMKSNGCSKWFSRLN